MTNRLIVYILTLLLLSQTYYNLYKPQKNWLYDNHKSANGNPIPNSVSNYNTIDIKISDTQSFRCTLTPITNFKSFIVYNFVFQPKNMHPDYVNIQIKSKNKDKIKNKYTLEPNTNKEYSKKVFIPTTNGDLKTVYIDLMIPINNTTLHTSMQFNNLPVS